MGLYHTLFHHSTEVQKLGVDCAWIFVPWTLQSVKPAIQNLNDFIKFFYFHTF